MTLIWSFCVRVFITTEFNGEELIVIALDEKQENNCKTLKKLKRTAWVGGTATVSYDKMKIDRNRRPIDFVIR